MKIKGIKTEIIRAYECSWLEFLDSYVTSLKEGSIVAVTSKVVSLCEGRVVNKNEIEKIDLIKEEADYYLLPGKGVKHNYYLTIKNNLLIPTAGIDESNADGDYVLWPADPQRSADVAREFLEQKFALKKVGVIITDSKTSPLRWGVTGVALAGSGFKALNDYRGQIDLFGRDFKVSQANVLDALAVTAVMVMGEGCEKIPVVVMEEMEERVVFTGRNPRNDELSSLNIDLKTDIYGEILSSVEWLKGGSGWQDIMVENLALKKYLKTEILPLYQRADVGHNQLHIKRVIAWARQINQVLNEGVDNDLLVTAVIYHDLGVTGNKEFQIKNDVRVGHNERSAAMVRGDKKLRSFFSEMEIERIAIACEQHRSSFVEKRNDILAKIVADADTMDSINFKRIIIYYRQKFPQATIEEIIHEMWSHYQKKQHPVTGYAKYDLSEAVELIREQRDLLWSLLDDEEEFADYMVEHYSDLLNCRL